MEQHKGSAFKRSKICVCGNRKFKGTPFCATCWSNIDESDRARLRPVTGAEYDAVFYDLTTALRSKGLIPETPAEPVYVMPPEGAASLRAHIPAKAPEDLETLDDILYALKVNPQQMDRLFLRSQPEEKAAALNYLLENDRIGSRAPRHENEG